MSLKWGLSGGRTSRSGWGKGEGVRDEHDQTFNICTYT
jgi:hypothetical protein